MNDEGIYDDKLFDLLTIINAKKFKFITSDERSSLDFYTSRTIGPNRLKLDLLLKSTNESPNYISECIEDILCSLKYNNNNKNNEKDINDVSWEIIPESNDKVENEIKKASKKSKKFFSTKRERIPRVDFYTTNDWVDIVDAVKRLNPVTIQVNNTNNKIYHKIINNTLCICVNGVNDINSSLLKAAAQDSDCLMISFEMFIAIYDVLRKNRSRFRYLVLYSPHGNNVNNYRVISFKSL